jgi:hypothetical protein
MLLRSEPVDVVGAYEPLSGETMPDVGRPRGPRHPTVELALRDLLGAACATRLPLQSLR